MGIGDSLASISCAGRSRALQPLGPEGVPGPVCCTGQTVTMCGPARDKRGLSAVCGMLGVPLGLVRSWPQLNNLIPIAMGSLVVAQTSMHRLHLQHGVPVISKDATVADARLHTWRTALFEKLRDGDTDMLLHLPVMWARVVIAPLVTPGQLLVQADNTIISVPVPTKVGKSIEVLVREALLQEHPSLATMVSSLRFVGDVMASHGGANTLLFFTDFVGDDVAAQVGVGLSLVEAASYLSTDCGAAAIDLLCECEQAGVISCVITRGAIREQMYAPSYDGLWLLQAAPAKQHAAQRFDEPVLAVTEAEAAPRQQSKVLNSPSTEDIVLAQCMSVATMAKLCSQADATAHAKAELPDMPALRQPQREYTQLSQSAFQSGVLSV